MDTKKVKAPSRRYANYVLFVLVLVYAFNFIDRNIISILAEDIRLDLGINDAQLGFMYGTVFAIFFAVFGIPLGRFADVWVRRSLIAWGLAIWSGFTVLSGFARSFAELTIYRMGVGMGEASASPASYSMLADYYPPRLRATVIAIAQSGVYIGGGVGLFLGGLVLDTWKEIYPIAEQAPLGLKGWQVAFMAVGFPGILLAIWVRTLREPVRGSSEGIEVPEHPAPFSVLGAEMRAMTPGINLVDLKRDGGSIKANILYALLIAAGAWGLTLLTGNPAQWIALGSGLYIVVTWVQSLAVRDPATFGMTLKTKSFVYLLIAVPIKGVIIYAMAFWLAPLMLRIDGAVATEVGMYIGASTALGGFTGVIFGGVAGDFLKRKHPSGRLIMVYLSVFGGIPFGLLTIYSNDIASAAMYNFIFLVCMVASTSVPAATVTDLVLPRMRGIAISLTILVGTFIGLAMGPFIVGFLSDMFTSQGYDARTSLQFALSSAFLILIVTAVFTTFAWFRLPEEEASRLERARALGEQV